MPDLSEKQMIDLIGQIYECAGQIKNDGWQHAFERVSLALNSGPGSLHFFVKDTEIFEPLADTNEPGFRTDFRNRYFDLLPFREQLLKLREGEILIRSKVCSDRTYAATQLYNEHFRRLGIFHVLHQNIADAGSANVGITLTRPKNRRDFDRKDMQVYMRIAPHIQRAAKLHINLIKANSKSRFYENAWDSSPQGMMLINERYGVEFKNKAADQHFQSGVFVLERGGKLSCSRPEDTRNLRALINGVFCRAAAGLPSNGGQYQLRLTPDSHPLSLLVAPYIETSSSGLVQRMAVIFVGDPRTKDASSFDNLCNIYGLTVSEGRVAQLLAHGHSVKEIGDLLSISENTARTHLKRIFSKTETNRQAELVKLVLRTPTTYFNAEE